MHSVNGYVYGNGPVPVMRVGQRVRWYTYTLGTEVDLHTPHWHGNTVTTVGMRSDMVQLLPGMMMVSDMVPGRPRHLAVPLPRQRPHRGRHARPHRVVGEEGGAGASRLPSRRPGARRRSGVRPRTGRPRGAALTSCRKRPASAPSTSGGRRSARGRPCGAPRSSRRGWGRRSRPDASRRHPGRGSRPAAC